MVAKVPDNGLNITDLSAGDDFNLTSDGAVISFGADGEIKLTHVADTGLTLKHTATADDKPIVLTLQTGETDIAANDVIGTINFQAPDEGTGSDAILVAAGIEAISEGDFAPTANSTKLSFKVASSEAASEKMSLSSLGALTVSNGLTLSDGDITLASGHGISFAATADGTNDDSELLDDYEEGTWTGQYKTSSGNATMHSTNKYGRYVKIGRMVKFWGYFGCAGAGSATGGQGLQMSGLPFTITNHANDYNVISVGYYSGLALEDAEAGVAGYVEISNSTIVFVHTNTGQVNNSNFYLDNLSTDGHMMISGEYLTD